MNLRTPAAATFVLAVAVVGTGCSTPGPAVPPGAAPTAPERPAEVTAELPRPPLERVQCFAGTQRVTLTTGETQPGAEILTRRTLDPEAGTIVEEILRVDPLPRVPPRLYTVVYRVEGDRFELAESGGAYAGSGTLRGETWRWTGWTSEHTLTSGIRVESENEIDGAGRLVTEQRVYGPDGRQVMTIEQTADPLPLAECDRRLREVAAPGPPPGG